MQAAANFAQLLHHRILIGDYALGPFEDTLALGGEAEELLPAHDDRNTQFILEPADRGRESWLGDIAALGSAAEMAFLGESDEIVELLEIHLALRVLRRQFGPHQGNGRGIDRLLAGVFKCRRQARAMSRLNPPQPPFGTLRMTDEIAWRKIDGIFLHRHVGRIACIPGPVDVMTFTEWCCPIV